MDYKNFKRWRVVIAFFIAMIVSIAVGVNNFYLAIAGVFAGVIFMSLVRRRFKEVVVDERVISISGKAARATYAIVTVFLAMLGLFLILSGRGHGDVYTESIGTIFSYTAMLLLVLYSVSYHYFNKKYGGDK